MPEPLTVSVIGLGKLGLPLAACLAAKGCSVIGVDVNRKIIDAVGRGESPHREPGVTGLLQKSKGRVRATADVRIAVRESRITFLVTATPSLRTGHFSVRQLLPAAKAVGKALRDKGEYHVVAVTSTVSPGTTRSDVLPAIEHASGKRCGVDFGLCYNPEFIALGSVVRDFLNPDFVLIGEYDKRSGESVAPVYERVCENNPPIRRMSIENAELSKIALNSFVTMKIAFANVLSELCERIPGGDVDLVTQALGYDRRIGPHYFSGGLGFGGPCFPRDNRAFAAAARRFGIHAFLSEATDRANREHTQQVVHAISSLSRPGGRIAILGVTYKPDTNVIDESAQLGIAEALVQKGHRVILYDPAGLPNARGKFGSLFEYADSIESCVADAEVCVVATPWRQFRGLDRKILRKTMRRAVVYDCWRILDVEALTGLQLHLLGRAVAKDAIGGKAAGMRTTT